MQPTEDQNRRLLRARDLMDRAFDQALDVPRLAQEAHMSPAHFSRQFRLTFGETPHRYLQRRRIERACALLRDSTLTVTDICYAVGFDSLGTFSRTFSAVVGRSPSEYRETTASHAVPTCFVKDWSRPSSFG